MAILTKTDAFSSLDFKLFSSNHSNSFSKKVSISLGKFKLCLKFTKCVTIKDSFNEVIWLSLQ